MLLEIISILPEDGNQNVTIDYKIIIETNIPVDPFSVKNGVSIYTSADSDWTGPGLSVMDTPTTSLMSTGTTYVHSDYIYTLEPNSDGVEDAKIIITPSSPFLPDRKYNIAIYPGNDASRFLTKRTTESPEIITNGDGLVSIVGAYTGAVDDVCAITFLSPTEISYYYLSKGEESSKSKTFMNNVPFSIDNLSLSISAGFSMLDTCSIDCYKASGITILVNNEFTTTHLIENAFAKSTKILTLNDVNKTKIADSISLIGSIPSDLSENLNTINPITLRFNKPLEIDQDIKNNINIIRTDLLKGTKSPITYYYKITDNTIKLFLTGAL